MILNWSKNLSRKKGSETSQILRKKWNIQYFFAYIYTVILDYCLIDLYVYHRYTFLFFAFILI